MIAESVGMHMTDMECLDFLEEAGPTTAGHLARVTGLTTGAITSVIDRLERAGFVRREANGKDRRKVIIRLIPEKAKTVDPIYESFVEEVQKVLSCYSDGDLEIILDYYRRLTAVYYCEIEKMQPSKKSDRLKPER